MTPDAAISLGAPTPIATHRCDFTGAHDPVLAATQWMRQHVRHGHKLSVSVDDTHPAAAALVDAAKTHVAHCEMEAVTIQSRAREWGRNFLTNLKRERPMATAIERPLQGRPAVIVAAGPSLDDNGHLLTAFQDKGACVIAVNTSVGACLHHGCTPHVVVSIENRAVDFPRTSAIHVLSLTANPATWEATDSPLGVTNHDPALAPYVLQLGGVPLPYNGSVACAATSIAYLWGAAPIILVGQDLAPKAERLYATGTPFGDVVCTYGEGTVESKGGSKSIVPLPTVDAPGWNGGTVQSTHMLLSFWAWYEKLAQRTTLINATEGGVHIRGSVRLTAAHALAAIDQHSPMAPLRAPEPCGHRQVVASLRGHAQRTLASDYMAVPPDFPLLGLWVIPEVLRLNSTTHDPVKRARGFRQAVRTGCEEILELTEGE